MGENVWKKICDETPISYGISSAEGGRIYSGGPAIYEMQLECGVMLGARVLENNLKVLEINTDHNHIEAVFLQKKALVRPPSAIAEARKYAVEIGLLGEQHPIINTAECIKMLENNSYAL